MYAIFRQVDGGSKWMEGIHWQAELHDPEANDLGLRYPVAVAWLTDFSKSLGFPFVMLDFIVVPDHFRRRGYATRLIEQCRERWPNLELTEPNCPAGFGLAQSLGEIEAVEGAGH